MKSDGLETDEVVARGDGGWDSGRPGRVVGDHLAVCPGAVEYGAGEETSLVDLEPLEGVRVDASAG